MHPKPLSTAPDESFFLENNRGSYMYVEVSLPKGEGPFPVVFMAHGFSGTIHSGGALELGARLAEAGIIAIRCDFDPFLAPDKSAKRTNAYALRDMEDDAATLIKYALDNYDADINRISIYGRSFGRRLAMSMANESIGGYDYKAMALVAPAETIFAWKDSLTARAKPLKEKGKLPFVAPTPIPTARW